MKVGGGGRQSHQYSKMKFCLINSVASIDLDIYLILHKSCNYQINECVQLVSEQYNKTLFDMNYLKTP